MPLLLEICRDVENGTSNTTQSTADELELTFYYPSIKGSGRPHGFKLTTLDVKVD